jgi:TRAP-type C4-dicarboxylate transport system permease small subunit|tara:strand:+ start:321 stop:905 length:585 start_codon:yes stop_codon:yes gene_type:complete
MEQKKILLRSFLDKLYLYAVYIAAFALLMILLIIVYNMVARWTGNTAVGATAYAGYAMATSAFFAMAYTLNQDGHIRVKMLLSKLGKYRKWGERWCYGMGSLISIYYFYYAARGAHFSYILNDISQQDDAWPIWIPQMAMVIGTLILAIAFLDRLYQVIFFDYDELEKKWEVKDEKAIEDITSSTENHKERIEN